MFGYFHCACVFVFCLVDSAHAQEIIRCPDWRTLVSPAALLTASERAGQRPFEDRLRASRSTQNTGKSARDAAPSIEITRMGGSRQAGSPPAACTYTIRSGDTLGSIAARTLGTSPRWPEIARVNPGIDPKRLRVGTSLNLPCAPQTAQKKEQGAAKPVETGEPLAGTGFLARLGGHNVSKPASAKVQAAPGTAKKATKTTTAAKPVPTPNPPLPVWTARKGEDFEAVLTRWAKTAGYKVASSTSDVWTLGVPVKIQGDFETALGQLVRGLGSSGTAPPIRIFSNKVVRLGGVP